MSHTLAELAEGDSILLAVSADPRFFNAKFKTSKLVTDLALEVARDRIIDTMRSEFLDKLATMYDRFEVKNGERPVDHTDEWDEALDDEVSTLLEPYDKLLSASWLGIHSVDTRLHVPGEIQKLSESFAAQVWMQLVYQRSDAEKLAGIGITESAVAAMLSPTIPLPPKEPPMSSSLNTILNKIMLSMPDDTTLEEDLDNASDTDDGLAQGAAQRLGITLNEAKALRAEREGNEGVIGEWLHIVTTGEMLPDEETTGDGEEEKIPPTPLPPPPPPKVTPKPTVVPIPMVTEASLPPPPPLPKAKPPEAPPLLGALPKGAQGRKRVNADQPPPPHAISQAALIKLKTYANIKDEDVASLFGVARPTMNNYLRGKGHAVPTPIQRETLKAFIQKHVNALNEVLEEIG